MLLTNDNKSQKKMLNKIDSRIELRGTLNEKLNPYILCFTIVKSCGRE